MEEWVRRIEEFFEGSRASRRAQDRSPWQLGTVLRKTTKTVSILLLSAIISMSLISYFVPARVLWPLEASGLAYSIVAVITALHFIDFIWFREQLCSFLCPYARFQGALTDEHSLVIAYNRARGEPRGKLRKGVRAGACIDCGKCAAVCPQGLDIRDGYQLECINCARCIDACEGVMTRLQAKSLIGYTQLGGEEKPSLLGGRTLAYSTLLVGLAVIFIVLISSRTNFDASIHRSPGTLYTTHADGFVQNSFILNLENHQSGHQEDRRFNISLPDLDNAEVIVPELSLIPGESLNTTLVLRVPQKQLHTRTFPIDFLIESGDDEVRIQTTFKSGL
jgi:cytochrome c oxidase accessory protein FixG